jgi:glycogen debranching enzyme
VSGGLQPWLHELTIAVDGNSTVLSGATGDIAPSGGEGLYVDDERVLSRLEVSFSGEAASPVAAEASGARAEFVGAVRGLGDGRLEATVDLRRSRALRPGLLLETVTVSSRAEDRVDTVLRVVLAADGAPLAGVMTGAPDPAAVAPTTHDGVPVFELSRHRVLVRSDPAPSRLETDQESVTYEYDLGIQPGQHAQVRLSVSTERTQESLFDADPGSDAVEWATVRVESDEPRLAPLLTRSLGDLRHLLLRDPLAPQDVFAAAGTPWYLTLFGRDSIWAARMLLPFGIELAAGTLRTLARRQGRRDDPASAEQPGKILHEVRRVPHEMTGVGISLPPVYYGTVDATALWVCLLVDAWRWGLPETEVRGLLPHLRAALGWLTGPGQPDGDGLLKYLDTSGHGLSNQGWKDSDDSMRFRDGRIAEGPIALVEAQAYAVEALLGAADLLDALGEQGGPGCRDDAGALADRIRQRYWVLDDGRRHLAMALDGQGRQVDALGSNMGHVLGTGALTASEAADVAATLTGPDLLDRFGLRTMGAGTGGFNPIGYHTGSVWTHDTAIAALGLTREGRPAEAGALVRALVDAGEAFGYQLPELYSGEPVLDQPAPYPASCRPQAWSAASAAAVVTVALGLRADVPRGLLHIQPAQPQPFGALRVEGLRVGDARITVALDRDGGVTVDGVPEGLRVVSSA